MMVGLQPQFINKLILTTYYVIIPPEAHILRKHGNAVPTT